MGGILTMAENQASDPFTPERSEGMRRSKEQVRRRACLRPAKEQGEALQPHRWHQQGDGEGRHGKDRPQQVSHCFPRRDAARQHDALKGTSRHKIQRKIGC